MGFEPTNDQSRVNQDNRASSAHSSLSLLERGAWCATGPFRSGFEPLSFGSQGRRSTSELPQRVLDNPNASAHPLCASCRRLGQSNSDPGRVVAGGILFRRDNPSTPAQGTKKRRAWGEDRCFSALATELHEPKFVTGFEPASSLLTGDNRCFSGPTAYHSIRR